MREDDDDDDRGAAAGVAAAAMPVNRLARLGKYQSAGVSGASGATSITVPDWNLCGGSRREPGYLNLSLIHI